MSRLVVLSKAEFRRRYGDDVAGIFDPPDAPGLVVVPKGTNTRTRLHELGHMTLGHTRDDGRDTVEKYIDAEVSAEAWAMSKMNRPLTGRCIARIVEQALEESMVPDPNYTVLATMRSLERHGARVSNQKRNWLNRWMKRIDWQRGGK